MKIIAQLIAGVLKQSPLYLYHLMASLTMVGLPQDVIMYFFFFFKLSTMHIVLVGSLLSHRLSQTVVESNNDYIPSDFVKLDQLGFYFIPNWELREPITTNSMNTFQTNIIGPSSETWLWSSVYSKVLMDYVLPGKETRLDMHVVQ